MFLKRALPLALVALVSTGCSLMPWRGQQNPRGVDPPTSHTAPEDRAGVAHSGPIDVDFLLNYYDQDGENSPVTGGIGTAFLYALEAGPFQDLGSVARRP